MGIFLQTALIPGRAPDKIQAAVNEITASHPDMGVIPDDCIFHAYQGGCGVLFNDDVLGYETLADALSRKTGAAVLLLYIYDDDYWGYHFYENGKELDCFSPVPDYFDEPPETKEKYTGNPGLVAKYFGVREDAIKNYYRCWRALWEEETTQEIPQEDADETAYPEDEYCYGDCWQMADFMEKLGYPWDGFEAETTANPHFAALRQEPAPQPAPPPFVRVSMRPAHPIAAFFLTHKTLENLPDIFEIPYIWDILKKYPEELFLQFDYEKYDEAAKTLTGLLVSQPENAELYILRAFCLISHPNPPRMETQQERLAREEQIRLDLDRAFSYAPDNVRLLRMHCQPASRLRHLSREPEVLGQTQLAFLDRLLVLDPGDAPAYLLAKAYCYERMGETEPARRILDELTHRKLPDAVDFALSFEEIFGRLYPGKDLKTELERDYKAYIRDFLADNPKKKFRQAELCWKRKRAVTPGLTRYEKEDLALLSSQRVPENKSLAGVQKQG